MDFIFCNIKKSFHNGRMWFIFFLTGLAFDTRTVIFQRNHGQQEQGKISPVMFQFIFPVRLAIGAEKNSFALHKTDNARTEEKEHNTFF